MTDDFMKKRRPPLGPETVIDIDKEILRLLARRANMLGKLRNPKGRVEPRVEKELRSAWEHHAGRMSRDARLTRQMFALLQEMEFLPRPVAGEERRPAFTLAPPRKPVDVAMAAPLACRRSRLYLTLAAVSGSACRIAPSLLNDPAIECVKMFNQAGTSLAWEDDGTLRAREGGGLTLADKVIYVGDDLLNFHLLLGQYAGKPSRAKFTGESGLKLADLSALRRFLPHMGVRLTNAVPKSDGLPVRIECSGMIPDVLQIPADLPADAIIGLLMGAPFWDRPVAFNLKDHPQAAAIEDEALAVLKECAADVSAIDHMVRVTPGPLRVPPTPPLGMDLNLAGPLLALPAVANGQVRLMGSWPRCAVADALCALLRLTGVDVQVRDDAVTAQRTLEPQTGPLDARSLPDRFAPLALALACVQALGERGGPMPLLPEGLDAALLESFCNHVGLAVDGNSLRPLPREERDGTSAAWTAPTPAWALALALAAFARPGVTLANPGIMTALYPAFWSLYNALPCPELKKTVAEPVHEKPVRRRIIAAEQAGTGSGDSDN